MPGIDKHGEMAPLVGEFLLKLESDIIYSLMVFVTFKMYHLTLTLRFIFSENTP